MPYTADELDMLEDWKDRAMGYRWLHYESMQYFRIINMRFVHASILLSTVASASGFSFTGSDKFGKGIGYAVGALNVVISLLNSYQRFTKAAEQTELHGSVAMQYGMLHRLLDTELRLSEQHQRTDLIPFARQEMDRLFAHSPSIPEQIINKYMKEYPNAKSKPELCDEISIADTPFASENLASILRSSFTFPTLSNRTKSKPSSEASTPKSPLQDELARQLTGKVPLIPQTRLTEVMTEVRIVSDPTRAKHKAASPYKAITLDTSEINDGLHMPVSVPVPAPASPQSTEHSPSDAESSTTATAPSNATDQDDGHGSAAGGTPQGTSAV